MDAAQIDAPATPTPAIAQPTPPTGQPSPLMQDRSVLTNQVIPGLESQQAEFNAEAQSERTLQQRIQERQRQQLEPLEAELTKGFMESGMATEPPQHNIGSLMKVAPLFMTMAAMAGAKGRLVGTAGLSALNGMVNGLVKGDVQQYDEHRQIYEEKIKEWHEYSMHIKTMVAELQKAYGTDTLNSMKAEQAAIRASGGVSTSLQHARQQVQTIDKISAQLKERETDDRAKRSNDKAKNDAKSAADLERLHQGADKFAEQVKVNHGKELDKTIEGLNRTITTLRKEYDGNQMPPEELKRLAGLKELLVTAQQNRLSESQPAQQPEKPASPDEIRAAKADADQAVRSGRMSIDAAKQRLAAAGITDWTPAFAGPASGAIQR